LELEDNEEDGDEAFSAAHMGVIKLLLAFSFNKLLLAEPGELAC
jgi:hypothetical protein